MAAVIQKKPAAEFIVFAHRGASGTDPENTLRAFRRAVETGARWIELDVQNVDGRLVVFHDARLERTTNGSGRLSGCPLETLRSLDAGEGERIPYLDEVITAVAGRAGLNIELKGKNTASAVAELLGRTLLNRTWKKEQFIVSSFHRRELTDFRRLCPGIRIGFLYDGVPLFFPSWFVRRLKPYSVHLRKDFLNGKTASWCRTRGMRVFAYTVNDPDEARRLVSTGANGIFTDFPEKFSGIVWRTD
jgi:glycerophosphoryl diester phosphodiesterase